MQFVVFTEMVIDDAKFVAFDLRYSPLQTGNWLKVKPNNVTMHTTVE